MKSLFSSTNWRKVSRVGMLLSRFLLLLSLLAILVTVTVQRVAAPYSYYVIVGEFAIFLICLFAILRMSTFRPTEKYDESRIVTNSPQVLLLMQNITYDIQRFREGSFYYFNGVRMYKYSTMTLAGISTILLGLSYQELPLSAEFQKSFPGYAKNIAFVIGAVITVYTGLMTYWNIEKYWLQNKSIEYKLQALRDEIENADRAGSLSPTVIQEKFESYQQIRGEFYKYWEGALSGKNTAGSGG